MRLKFVTSTETVKSLKKWFSVLLKCHKNNHVYFMASKSEGDFKKGLTSILIDGDIPICFLLSNSAIMESIEGTTSREEILLKILDPEEFLRYMIQSIREDASEIKFELKRKGEERSLEITQQRPNSILTNKFGVDIELENNLWNGQVEPELIFSLNSASFLSTVDIITHLKTPMYVSIRMDKQRGSNVYLSGANQNVKVMGEQQISQFELDKETFKYEAVVRAQRMPTVSSVLAACPRTNVYIDSCGSMVLQPDDSSNASISILRLCIRHERQAVAL